MIRPLIVLSLVACNPAPDDTGDPTPHGAAVTTTDFSVGALATVDLDSFDVTDNVATTSSDPFVQFEDGLVYQVNGSGVDSISVYEPGDFGTPLHQFSTGTGTSPREVALIGDQLFVTLYETDYIAVLDPVDGTSLGEVDLSAYGGADGLPEASTMVELGGDLYVALERLDRNDFWSDDEGTVVRVDPDTLAVTDSWAVGPSPKVYVDPTSDAKVMIRTGMYGAAVGGIRTLDPTLAAPDAMLLDAATLGFGISEWAVAPSGRAVAIGEHTDVSFNVTYTIECYDPDQGLATVLGPTGDWLANPEIDADGRVWIPSQSYTGPSGLLVVDAETCAVLTTAPIATTLPPYRVAFY